MATPSSISTEGELLWKHRAPEETQMWAFMQLINRKHHQNFTNYHELYDWSITNISALWAEIWDFCGIRTSQPYSQVLSDENTMFPPPHWFAGARLNFAENLLFPNCDVDEDAPAVLAATETTREVVSWKDLRERVRRCQIGMRAINLQPGDRVAGYVANHTNALVGMLAATSMGGVWTAVSPDTGVAAVLDRMIQIEPKMLFTDNAVMYNGKTHPVLPKVQDIINSLPTLQVTVVFETVGSFSSEIRTLSAQNENTVITYADFIAASAVDPTPIHFKQLEPDAPVYILYSSGTTGAPKCIVHGAIGTLIQHKKEHILQADIQPGDRFFYFTTCTWMMWHWLVSGLAAGATIVLYDGSPFQYLHNKISTKDDLAMPRLISELQITHFGTSAKYLSLLEQKSLIPADHNLPLPTLRAIYSTGSPLAPSTFQYIYHAFPPTIHLASITGGTDIISLFGAPSPLLPVYVGEIQTLGLGMACQAWSFDAHDLSRTGEPGDLVCIKPFPCQPIRFHGPNGHKAYQNSYFAEFPGVWHHGDFIRFIPASRGLVMLGRSDGVLKPSGVRFGSAEIYNVLLKHFPEEIEDALCIGRRRAEDADEAVVLFVKMRGPTEKDCDETLQAAIKKAVRSDLSARHVPAVITACPEIPVTSNGKKVEKAVKQILCGLDIPVSASVANPECLGFYRDWNERN